MACLKRQCSIEMLYSRNEIVGANAQDTNIKEQKSSKQAMKRRSHSLTLSVKFDTEVRNKLDRSKSKSMPDLSYQEKVEIMHHRNVPLRKIKNDRETEFGTDSASSSFLELGIVSAIDSDPDTDTTLDLDHWLNDTPKYRSPLPWESTHTPYSSSRDSGVDVRREIPLLPDLELNFAFEDQFSKEHHHQPRIQTLPSTTPRIGYDAALYPVASNYHQQQQAAKGTGTWPSIKKTGATPIRKPVVGKPKIPKEPQFHNCNVCKISCTGPQSYREHLEGQKHKKKEAAAKAGTTTTLAGRRRQNQLRYELCDVTSTDTETSIYSFENLLELYAELRNPIPCTDPVVVASSATSSTSKSASSPTVSKPTSKIIPPVTTDVQKALATPNITFVDSPWSQYLHGIIKEMPDTSILPSQSHLQDALSRWGKKSLEFTKMINRVEWYIREQCDFLKELRPCYLPNNNEIVFVAFTYTIGKTELPYKVFLRKIDEYSKEGAAITYCEESLKKPFTRKEARQLTATLQKHSKHLMEKHSNIQMISACSVKSKMYGTDKATISLNTCIVIYVDVKGMIPLLEVLLPTKLDEFPVDVREGGVWFLDGKRAGDYHDHLKMGCQISSRYNAGTLGAFIEEPTTQKLYCITCAHVFLNANTTRRNPDGSFHFSKEEDIHVYQPDASSISNQIGRVEKLVYKSGGIAETGVDIALISISSRRPISGDFPESSILPLHAGFTADRPMKFSSGEVYRAANIDNQCLNQLIKFGCVSGITRGAFHLHGLSVKRRELDGSHWDFPIQLHNQIEVLHVGPSDFSKPGDSGSLVFTAHNGNFSDMRAVGILAGQTSNSTYFVTPIWDVLDTLGLPLQLKIFPNQGIQESANFNPQSQSVTNDLSVPNYTELGRKIDKLDQNNTQLWDKINKLDQNYTELGGKIDKLDQNSTQLAKKLEKLGQQMSQEAAKQIETEEQNKERHGQLICLLHQALNK